MIDSNIDEQLKERRTKHGIPSTRKGYYGYQQMLEMQNNLSKGHLSKEHQEKHVHHMKVGSMVVTELTGLSDNTTKKRLYKMEKAMPPRLLACFQLMSWNVPVNALYSDNQTMSPYSVRKKGNIVTMVKRVRPLTIYLGRTIQNGKTIWKRSKQILFKREMRKQVILPDYKPLPEAKGKNF